MATRRDNERHTSGTSTSTMKAVGQGHGQGPLTENEVDRLASSAAGTHEPADMVQIPGRTQWRNARVVHAAARMRGMSCSAFVNSVVVPAAYEAIGWDAPIPEQDLQERIKAAAAEHGLDPKSFIDSVVTSALQQLEARAPKSGPAAGDRKPQRQLDFQPHSAGVVKRPAKR